MRIRLRTLFLITTVVAIIAFTFTLGSAEGVVAMLFFACLLGAGNKKERLIASLLFVFFLLIIGVSSRLHLVAEVGEVNCFGTSFLSVLFTGKDQKRQEEVFQFIGSEISDGRTVVIRSSRSDALPFFRTGYIKLHVDVENNLPEIEADVRQKLAKEFPDLKVTIKSHSAADSKP